MAPADDSAPAEVLDDAPEAADAIAAAWTARRAVHVRDPSRPPVEAPVPPPGTATVVATSGTTGAPRLVAHDRRAVEASCTAVSAALDVDPAADRWLACLPLRHVAGLAIVLRGIVTGTPVTVHDRFDVKRVALAAGECTLVSLVPTQLVRLLDAGAPLHRFRAVLLGGAPVPLALADRAAAAGVALHVTYGLTETFGGCVHDGRPVAGVDVRLAEGTGEVLVRGPVLCRGYVGEETTPGVARTADGWLRTGDVGRTASDGRLEIVDRLTDVVITGGVNVSPVAVEQVLVEHPAVADACVVGAPDPEWGERVVACVVFAPGQDPPTLDALRAHAGDRLPAAALPREVRAVERVPRTASGKPQRWRLRG